MLNQGLFLTNSTSFEHKLKVTSIIYLGRHNLFHKKKKCAEIKGR
jgi:hypothetical protein